MPSFITQHIHHDIYPEWRFTWLLTPPVTDVRNRTNLHWSTAKVGASQTGDICLLILWPGPCIYMSLLTWRSTKCSFMLAVPLRAALLTSIHRCLPLSPNFVKPPGPKAISFWTCPLVFCGNRLWQFPELNHPRQVITFLENRGGCLKWVKGRRGSHWTGLIHKTLVLQYDVDRWQFCVSCFFECNCFASPSNPEAPRIMGLHPCIHLSSSTFPPFLLPRLRPSLTPVSPSPSICWRCDSCH